MNLGSVQITWVNYTEIILKNKTKQFARCTNFKLFEHKSLAVCSNTIILCHFKMIRIIKNNVLFCTCANLTRYKGFCSRRGTILGGFCLFRASVAWASCCLSFCDILLFWHSDSMNENFFTFPVKHISTTALRHKVIHGWKYK